MKFAATTLALVLTTMIGASAFAADPTPRPNSNSLPQQQKMKDCNAQAGDKKGDERKEFMSTCLKAGSTATATPAATPAATAAPAKPMTAQQEKMKTCNADATAKHLKGAERKTFMSTCLKGDNAAAAAH